MKVGLILERFRFTLNTNAKFLHQAFSLRDTDTTKF